MRVQLCPTPTSAVPYAYAIAVAWSRNAVLDPGANPFCATTVAMQIDHLAIASGGSGQAVHPVIGQGSSLYALPQWQTTAVPGSWTTMTLGPVPITSFHRLTSPYSFDPSRTPDLGPSAAPLTFGLMFRNSSGVTAYCTTHCYDNWQVTLSCEATFTTGHCPGCAGCTGVPVLGAIGLPVIPNPAFALTVQNACPNSPTVFVASLSRSGCQGVGVPLPLDMHGFPGCTLCVCPDVLFFNITDGGGNATQPFPIGPNTDYLGLPVHLQAFVLGPPFHATPKAVAVLGR